MWGRLRALTASFRGSTGGKNVLSSKRAEQQRLDTHRLFLYTTLYAQQAQGGLHKGFEERVIKEVRAQMALCRP